MKRRTHFVVVAIVALLTFGTLMATVGRSHFCGRWHRDHCERQTTLNTEENK